MNRNPKRPTKPGRGRGRGADRRQLPASFDDPIPQPDASTPQPDAPARSAEAPKDAGPPPVDDPATYYADQSEAPPPSKTLAAHAFGQFKIVKVGGNQLILLTSRSVATPWHEDETVFAHLSALVDAILDDARRKGERLSERAAERLALEEMPEDWRNEKLEARLHDWRMRSKRQATRGRSERNRQGDPLRDAD